MTNIILVPAREARHQTGFSRTALYERQRKGLFTPPIELSERSRAWPDYEIDQLNRAVIAGKTEGEIKSLVSDLMRRRETLLDALA